MDKFDTEAIELRGLNIILYQATRVMESRMGTL